MEKTMLKKMIAAALAGCLMLLSACGGGAGTAETGTETAPETAAESTEEVTTEEVTETADDGTDVTAPIFVSFTSPATLDRGEDFDIHRYISYIDDLDPEVDLVVEGEVDTAAVGEYRLTVTVEDDAGNEASRELTVQVTEPEPSGSSNVTPVAAKSFSDFSARYKKDDTMVGIDVSRWQGVIDFNKVAAAGCEFVIIRIGGYSDGLFQDKYYADNIRNAKAAGLKVGVYWYSEEHGADMIREDADYLYSLLGGESLDFPIFFDWEDYRNLEDYKMSIRDLNDTFLAFREEAEARGYRAALYNSKYYLGLLWSDAVKGDGVWLAHYIDETTYEGKYFLWQQGFGRINGINGDVDVDVFYPGKLAGI